MQFQLTIEGNIAAEPRTGTAKNGSPYTNFPVIYTSRYQREGRWVDGHTITIGITCWRNLARNTANLRKGDPVIVDLNDDLRVTVHAERAYLQASARNVAVSARFSPATSHRRSKDGGPIETIVPETGGYDVGASAGYTGPSDQHEQIEQPTQPDPSEQAA